MKRAIHPESLLQIPLVRAALDDPRVRIVRRAVDGNWRYLKIVAKPFSGFMPLGDVVFVPARSRTSSWLERPEGPTRHLNASDWLVREVLFMTHDYLHQWTMQALLRLWPQPLDELSEDAAGRETLAFLSLVTEAAATVGLDYWYLSCVSLNRVCPIGTTMSTLTVDFRQADVDEFRRFDEGLEIQSPRFLWTLARFYCDGEFPGFSRDDIISSPMLQRWMSHELEYGVYQRRYIREWVAYLSGTEPIKADVPVPIRRKWRDVVEAIGDELFALVKDGKQTRHPRRAAPTLVRRTRARRASFTNVCLLDDEEIVELAEHAETPAELDKLLGHVVCRHEFAEFPARLHHPLAAALAQRNTKAVLALLEGHPRVPVKRKDEPADIFLLT